VSVVPHDEYRIASSATGAFARDATSFRVAHRGDRHDQRRDACDRVVQDNALTLMRRRPWSMESLSQEGELLEYVVSLPNTPHSQPRDP